MTHERVPFLERHADYIFSIKTFLAAVLALLIALSVDLPRPYWALATVYICSQPHAGATRSKALYRIAGTLIGAAATVALIPNFVNAPELLSLALALWVALCLYVSLLDKTPRSYMFMLGGYTVALIGFPAVSEPGAIFDVALARTEEITLGIVCASLVSTLVLPHSVGAPLAARVKVWLCAAREIGQQILTSGGKDGTTPARLMQLASDAVDIETSSDNLAYEIDVTHSMNRSLRALRLRMLMLPPLLSSIADRLDALGDDERQTYPHLMSLAGDISHWISEDDDTQGRADRLRASISRQLSKLDAVASWNNIVVASLLTRMRDLVDISADCRVLNRVIVEGDRPCAAKPEAQFEANIAPLRHIDRGMAVRSAGGAVLAILLSCTFWIATGWVDGSSAPMIAAVGCCFFATTDDPTVGLRGMAKWTLVSMVIVAAYLFAILPAISNVEMLIVVLAPAFLLCGLLIARPKTVFIGMMLAINIASLMTLQATYNADFAIFANGSIAFFVGAEIATMTMLLVRSVGAEWSLHRLMRAGWIALAQAADRRGNLDRTAFAGLMINRIGLMAQRMPALTDRKSGHIDNFAQLRVALNIFDMRSIRHRMSPRTIESIDRVLDEIGRDFRKYDGGVMSSRLLATIDRALSNAMNESNAEIRRSALIGLAGIRRGLFPKSTPYLPEAENNRVGSVAA